ncbi:rhodanese-like domain-containing protein [Deinococcus sp.]|uniref:rhodanese-like domain-containing protein n=1 Tax=Deinococcus sp. TaxID=47478 RepID=UPI002869E4B8|nr:rhodanese-like domain-containing protein [Deinococcus sp.]
MEEVTPQEGQRRVQAGALLVDVREQNEFDDVHADGALLVPLSEFETRYAELPTDRELVMVCRSGARSARAGEFLQQQGYTQIANLTGGTNAWVEAGLPSVKGQG